MTYAERIDPGYLSKMRTNGRWLDAMIQGQASEAHRIGIASMTSEVT